MGKAKLWCKKQICILAFINPIKIKLINNWNKWYKIWSVWFFILIGIAPDLYNSISSMGWLEQAPPAFVWVIRILASIGFASRLIKQQKLQENKDANTNNN